MEIFTIDKNKDEEFSKNLNNEINYTSSELDNEKK